MGSGVLGRVAEFASRIMGSDFSHGFPHVLRVRRLAWNIVRAEGLVVDGFVLDASIYLHDTGRLLGEPHAVYSAYIARGLLGSYGVDDGIINRVVNAILYHSYSYSRRNRVEPMGDEAKVLSDADKLDALGVIGVLRMYDYSMRHRRPISGIFKHFEEKIRRLPELMHYGYSRRLAERRLCYMEKIVNTLYDEIQARETR